MVNNNHHNGVQARNNGFRKLRGRDATPTGTEIIVGVEASASASSASISHHGITEREKGLAAMAVILVVAILGIFIWRFGVWRRRKARAASNMINVSMMEKIHRNKAARADFESASRMPDEFNIALPTTPASSAKRSSTNRPWTRILPGAIPDSSKPRENKNAERSPPPSYAFANGISNTSVQSQRVPLPALEIPSHPQTAKLMVPSPRSSSFGPDSPMSKALMTSLLKHKSLVPGAKPLPRTMFVQATFKPSLSDELLIKMGEQLRMLEEYEDEWCLVQRIGEPDTQKGVIPRFCLREL